MFSVDSTSEFIIHYDYVELIVTVKNNALNEINNDTFFGYLYDFDSIGLTEDNWTFERVTQYFFFHYLYSISGLKYFGFI